MRKTLALLFALAMASAFAAQGKGHAGVLPRFPNDQTLPPAAAGVFTRRG